MGRWSSTSPEPSRPGLKVVMSAGRAAVSTTSRASQLRLLERTALQEGLVTFARSWNQSPAVTGRTAVKVAKSLLVYDRAVLYDYVSRKAQARREFERMYAEAPDFEDVAERLGGAHD